MIYCTKSDHTWGPDRINDDDILVLPVPHDVVKIVSRCTLAATMPDARSIASLAACCGVISVDAQHACLEYSAWFCRVIASSVAASDRVTWPTASVQCVAP